jgi:hypothetical protein
METEKPITENQKQIANAIYKFLYHQHRFVTKEELCAELGWEYNSSNDRKIRDTINVIKKLRPIVATPNRKGYFAPTNASDLEEVKHQWKYIDSIIADLMETKKPLIEFCEKFGNAVNDIFGI